MLIKQPFLLIRAKTLQKTLLIKKANVLGSALLCQIQFYTAIIHKSVYLPRFRVLIDALFLFPELYPQNKKEETKMQAEYAADKPNDCRFCYFWKNDSTGCSLGKDNCYYLIAVPPKPKSECDGCPYGRAHPCIGWCTKKVMREVGIK
ncbi:MAG: hypothetical protein ACLRPX_06660 [Ruthenibacterium sp.]